MFIKIRYIIIEIIKNIAYLKMIKKLKQDFL